MVANSPFENIADCVFLIPDRMFPLYVIRAERNVLVDCGVLQHAEKIQQSVRQILRGGSIDLALLTHSHYDHVGACSFLQKKNNFKIISSVRTKEVLENPEAISFIDRMNREFKPTTGAKTELHFSPPQKIHSVKEGDRISLSKGQFVQVHETPGHTRCSISFFLQPEKILFAGDAVGVMERTGRIKPLFLSSYSQYEASLRKLQGMGAEILALSHNRFIRGPKRVSDFLARSLEATIHFKDKLLSYLTESDDFEKIAGRILSTEFSEPAVMGPQEAMMINLVAMIRAVKREFTLKQ